MYPFSTWIESPSNIKKTPIIRIKDNANIFKDGYFAINSDTLPANISINIMETTIAKEITIKFDC